MPDQAESLRQWARENAATTGNNERRSAKKTRLIGVASGKGGVGKSNIALNFALKLQELGEKVALMDADLGFSNIDILLGVKAQHTLQDVLEGKTSLDSAFMKSFHGIAVISGSSGVLLDDSESKAHLSRFAHELARVDGQFDRIYVDFGAGFGRHSEYLMALCDEVMILSTPEPTALADAYTLVKMAARRGELPILKLIINRARSVGEAVEAAEKFSALTRRFLHVETDILGYVLEDFAVARAVKKQVPFIVGEPNSIASRCISQIAKNTLNAKVVTYSPKRGLSALIDRLRRSF